MGGGVVYAKERINHLPKIDHFARWSFLLYINCISIYNILYHDKCGTIVYLSLTVFNLKILLAKCKEPDQTPRPAVIYLKWRYVSTELNGVKKGCSAIKVFSCCFGTCYTALIYIKSHWYSL